MPLSVNISLDIYLYRNRPVLDRRARLRAVRGMLLPPARTSKLFAVRQIKSMNAASGQTLPSHSALVRINVCSSPRATKSRTRRKLREGPQAASPTAIWSAQKRKTASRGGLSD